MRKTTSVTVSGLMTDGYYEKICMLCNLKFGSNRCKEFDFDNDYNELRRYVISLLCHNVDFWLESEEWTDEEYSEYFEDNNRFGPQTSI